MKNTSILRACFLSFLSMLPVNQQAQAQTPPPAPPVAVNGADSHGHDTMTQPYEETGEMIVSIWTHITECNDAQVQYVTKQATVEVTPPEGTDVEDFSFMMPSPNTSCTLERWVPEAGDSGGGLGGNVTFDNTGFNLGATGAGAASGSGPTVTSAGQTARGEQSASWDVDFPDTGDYATKRSYHDFLAVWKCPCGTPVPPVVVGKVQVWVEIDDWGFDTDYWFVGGNVYSNITWNDRYWSQEQDSIDDHALLIDIPDTVGLKAGDSYYARARIHDPDPQALENALVTLEAGGKVFTLDSIHWLETPAGIELSARIEIPESMSPGDVWQPIATAYLLDGTVLEAEGSAIPILTSASVGDVVSAAPGFTVFELTAGEIDIDSFVLSSPLSEEISGTVYADQGRRAPTAISGRLHGSSQAFLLFNGRALLEIYNPTDDHVKIDLSPGPPNH